MCLEFTYVAVDGGKNVSQHISVTVEHHLQLLLSNNLYLFNIKAKIYNSIRLKSRYWILAATSRWHQIKQAWVLNFLTCGHKDFRETLPMLKRESHNHQEVLMFTELVPPLTLLWHIPHADAEAEWNHLSFWQQGPAHRSCSLANKSLFEPQPFCLLYYYYPDKLLCALFRSAPPVLTVQDRGGPAETLSRRWSKEETKACSGGDGGLHLSHKRGRTRRRRPQWSRTSQHTEKEAMLSLMCSLRAGEGRTPSFSWLRVR